MSQIIDIKNQLAELASLSPKKRLDAIINHPTPLKLVRAMEPHDVLLTIRGVGGESALELVEMLHPKQIQTLLDFEIWHNDELDVKAAGHYFSLIFEANQDVAVAQIHGLDIELIGLMFKTISEIYDTTLNEEPIDFPQLYSTSPGGRFVVCFTDDPQFQNLAQSLHTFLEMLYGRDLTFALRLLESLRYELFSGLEETSLWWRQCRLSEYGILPRHERLQFFAPVSALDIKQIMAKEQPKTFHNLEAPLSIMVVKNDFHNFTFLKSALSQCSIEHNQRFWQELQHATINMHASLSGDFGDEEAMVQSAEYVKFLCELGLMQLCQGHIEKAHDTLQTTQAKYLIRLGRTTLVGLRKRLTKAVHENPYLGEDFMCADSPLREVARALCLPEPRFYEGLSDPKKLTIRYFLSVADVNATLKAVHELIFRAQLVSILGPSQCRAKDNLPHATLMARAMVNQFVGHADLFNAVTMDDLARLTNKQGVLSVEFTQFARQFGEKTSQAFIDSVKGDAELIPSKTSAFIHAILAQLEQNPSLLLE